MSKFRGEIRSKFWRGCVALTMLSGLLVLMSAAPAFAFTTGPHEEILDDAMSAEGFGHDARSVMKLDNTFMDLYQWVGASANPYSGQGTSTIGRLLIGNISTENWPMSVVAAATRSHFDNNPEGVNEGLSKDGLMESLGTTQGITAEWERLQRAVWTLLQEARLEDNPEKALAVLGASSHELEDFYAHTNWIEPRRGALGADGPGWKEEGYGTYPTWFDVPVAAREKFTIYGDSTPGHSRKHGYWSSDGNVNVNTMMNKDSPPRPFYLEAAITADFATRQWAEAARLWINDDHFWHEMQTFNPTGRKEAELNEELSRLFEVMLYSGRWEGQGEPFGGPSVSGAAGDLLELRHAVVRYFGDFRKTKLRKEFESLILRLANPKATGRVGSVPSSQEMQKQLWVVVMRVTRMVSHGLGDVWPVEADMYAQMKIDGQRYESDVIHGHDSFSFGNPYEPFTKYRIIPRDKVEREPIESIEVEVKTGNASGAGTDGDNYLILGNDLRYHLDKNFYDDFEQGDSDRYSVPIDADVRKGLAVGDIRFVEIQHTGGDNWEMEGIRLWVNGRVVYNNQGLHRWMKEYEAWWATNYVYRNPTGPKIPVWLQLREDDYPGADDQGDVNPYDNRDSVLYGYVPRPGKPVVRTSSGGKALGGRLGYGGDDAAVTFSLETLVPELINAPETVFRQVPPDLVITALNAVDRTVTVMNVGGSAAGPFRLRSESERAEDTQLFAGLAAGASETRQLHGVPICEEFVAVVDDLEQVDESNENNNTASTDEAVVC